MHQHREDLVEMFAIEGEQIAQVAPFPAQYYRQNRCSCNAVLVTRLAVLELDCGRGLDTGVVILVKQKVMH